VEKSKRAVRKYVASAVPEGCRVKVFHLTPKNSSRRQRKGNQWVTIATVVNGEDQVLAKGIAQCKRGDTPNRKIGRDIAVGKAIKAYYEPKIDTEALFDPVGVQTC
jgi:hypothetical protein